MRRWIFLRHGESVANAEGWLSGQVDTPLTERGRDQARQAARDLAGAQIAAVLCSDLSRAVETARIAVGPRPLTPRIHRELGERSMGEWARHLKAPLRASGAFDAMRTWEGKAPGGESYADLDRRVIPTLAGLEAGSGDVLVVAHGGVIRVILRRTDGLAPDAIRDVQVPNAIPIIRELPEGFWAQSLLEAP